MSETFSFRVYVRIETGLVSYFQSSTLHLFFSQRNGSRPIHVLQSNIVSTQECYVIVCQVLPRRFTWENVGYILWARSALCFRIEGHRSAVHASSALMFLRQSRPCANFPHAHAFFSSQGRGLVL